MSKKKPTQTLHNLPDSTESSNIDPVAEAAENFRNKPNNDTAEKKVLRSPKNEINSLKNDPDFQKHVLENLWETRRDRGYHWKSDVFSFIEDVYSFWLEQGRLVQSDLKALDPKLYSKMHNQLSAMSSHDKRTTLERLNLPTESEMRLDSLDSEDAKQKLLEGRRMAREGMRILRSIR